VDIDGLCGTMNVKAHLKNLRFRCLLVDDDDDDDDDDNNNNNNNNH
jgi:hypothetical protein